jgi:hypothetical protein
MSDTSAAGTTPTEPPLPITPGAETSEFATTKLVIYMGIFSQVIGFATSILTALQVLAPQWLWVGVALMIAGKAAALLKALGYDATRASIKNAGQAAAAKVAAAQALVPLKPIGDVAEKVFGTT